MIFKIFLLLIYAVGITSSAHAYNDLAINSQISAVRSALDGVNSQIFSAEMRLSSIDSEILSARNEQQLLRVQESIYLNEAAAFNKLHHQYEMTKKKEKEKLRVLLQEIHKLESKTYIKFMEVNALRQLREAIINIEHRLKAINEMHRHIMSFNHTAQELHLTWVSEFTTLVEAHTPNFKGVVDLTTFKKEYGTVLSFLDEIPPRDTIELAEDKLINHIISSLQKIRDQQTAFREIVSTRGMAVYIENRQDNSIASKFAPFDQHLNDYHHSLFRLKSFTLIKRDKRAYLINSLSSTWIRLIKKRLHVANVNATVELIKEIESSLRGNSVYAEARAKLEKKNYAITEKLRRFFIPRHSLRLALQSKQYAENLDNKIDYLPVTDNMKVELKALVKDYKDNYEQKIKQAEEGISNDERYVRERKRQVKIFQQRLMDKLTPYCKEVGEAIISANKSDFGQEAKFLEYKTKCL